MLNLSRLNLSIGGHHILRDVSFDVAQGELMCLLGPSGCGKTSTLRLIAGLERPQAGSVSIHNQIVTSDARFLPPQRRGVGFLFQDFALFPHLSVRENVAFGLSAFDRSEAGRRTMEMLEQMRLVEYAAKYPHTLSGGQQQRVALARALAPAPHLLLLDEPFSGLDTRLRAEIREETREVLKHTGVTILMVTHDWEESMLVADRIALMRDGKIVQIDTPQNLYVNPVDAFAARFFGEVNRVEGRVDGEWVTTALGRFSNAAIAAGTPVEVLIRPEALCIGDEADAQSMQVCSVHYVGSNSLVRLSVDGHDLHLNARFAGHLPTRVGERLRVQIDPRQTFVFRKSD